MTLQTTMPIHALRAQVRLGDPHTVRALQHTGRVLLGLADDDEPVTLPDEATNTLVVTGAGAGMTTVLRSLAAQALHRGAHVDVLDLGRRPSHPWADRLPRTTAHTTPAAVHDYLVLQLDRLRHPGPTARADWTRRRVILIEHADHLVFALRQYWSHTRPDSQLAEAPGVEALTMLLAAGNACGIQIAAGSARALPPRLGDLSADLFPTRLVAHASPALWSRVAPGAGPHPPLSLTPGRMHTVHGHRTTRFQALHLSETEARAWARTATDKEHQ
ncbi:cell division protein FtsK [Streptomyces sp. NPDC001889]